mmetsp:Transcript_24981/g.38782  ORF Transcript_24981/g.38782 Transcript_24981/m.38782 type:complete len:209 (-) Transcript_24981:2458-3084(-)
MSRPRLAIRSSSARLFGTLLLFELALQVFDIQVLSCLLNGLLAGEIAGVEGICITPFMTPVLLEDALCQLRVSNRAKILKDLLANHSRSDLLQSAADKRSPLLFFVLDDGVLQLGQFGLGKHLKDFELHVLLPNHCSQQQSRVVVSMQDLNGWRVVILRPIALRRNGLALLLDFVAVAAAQESFEDARVLSPEVVHVHLLDLANFLKD